MLTSYSLAELGWRPYFQQQLSLAELESCSVARVSEQHRSQLQLLTEQGARSIQVTPNMPSICVGDWLLINDDGFVRLLERATEFSRKAPGSKLAKQLIAANLDTVLVVMSLNHDFSLSRLERYLALINQTGARPVVVLTKADLCDDIYSYQSQVQALDPLLDVVCVNALDQSSVSALAIYCKTGQTLAVMGSSGVGKSTLLNSLQGEETLQTGSIREDDSKGRHTTTSRSLHVMAAGGLLLDTPGMRELQLSDVESGIATTFADIEALAQHCRFSDCSHQGEPGCAVTQAIESGELELRRLTNYLKLSREQALNAASLAERRAKDKALGKMYRTIQGESKKLKKGY
ncbi:ribosome small subunit-dependent GTPase A [Shewanella sp. WXL01]|uniref:Small ribosomal subunit biogenesis GTPase RsgA n=1 Tax=Shewanella maritima TaxID=2520507 RepID=A0A411PIP2_9GAMM|nr:MULTISPECIES: ribosome small subunit-dependent GTPase A [Shewanella]NKF52762.1 ribosome small subunit-dependent GTPase A [Shewanella sp. WXL01]QBF83368.1 ribosome small subunit-dependent GTPase A [Shewanella maritima]